MKVSKEEYKKMYKKETDSSPTIKNCFFAFVIGGLICVIGQLLNNFYMDIIGLTKKESQLWVSVTLIGLGSFLTAVKIYDRIAKHAGAGTIVPITGFANSIVSPAIEFKKEGQVLGTSAQMFTIAGPVLVFGITSSIIYGLIAWIFKLY
ncbi:MAG: stage V sporulation protein AC [Candidatus Improbicoccus pseudotrichonymphae]|uniref:Stage V sporulation protein AC n=1 Tax=Candidatus Improbicoccus pseudotrichonymphae TaxID=3033792 RepID=A0AA48HYT6_9FIRM|nr:MAG: stage V sporulation protein AC [Candidatus Improbicoccus pseudotrichonymphae]